MSRASDPDVLVLLTLRLRTLADLDAIAGATDRPADSVAEALARLDQQGWARHRDGRVEGWMLTPDGRDACAAQLAAELDAAGGRDHVSAAYRRFLSVNQPLLDLCTDWQLREAGSTEGTQPLTTALAAVDAVGQSVGHDLASTLARFAGYGPRLAAARRAVDGGEAEWLTGPTIDSYHTVWFELHENLLATLGLERGHEEIGAGSLPTSLQEAR